ncbi:MAG: family 78 glycoside hydrolase catalytic domain, partial [Bacilli bacterium]|nr:family 78 glycoside hydrolase catalytic domain [Bacilli bacterium]
MKCVNLKTEYLHNPLGLGIAKPTLTWNIGGEGIRFQKAFEIAYRINDGEEMKDLIETSSTRFVLPDQLSSRDFVTWMVRIQNEEGEWSPYSGEAHFSIGLLEQSDWSAKWIRGDYPVSKKQRYPVDCFRKEFTITGPRKGMLYISALGLYEAYINGTKVGDAILAPGSTDPRKRVQYDVYDVSSLLKEGKNEIVVLLADGWYRGSIGAKGFTYVFGKFTQILAQLEFSDGEKILTDESWQWSNDGPLTFADLKDGEIVDFNKTPSFQGHAKVGSYEKQVSASNNSHVVVMERNQPIKEFVSKTGKTVYQFANNVAGNIALKLQSKAGGRIRLVMGEMLDENDDVTLKNVQCIRKGKKTPLQEVILICKEGLNEYESKFFYGGFQYLSILENDGV